MPLHFTHRMRRFGATRAAVLGGLLSLVVGGTFAYRYLFHRPGEAAISLIPGDAMMVMTLDTTPSEQQVAVFKRITDALHREGLDKQMDDFLTQTFEKSPIGRELRPLLTDSFALALWDKSGQRGLGDPDMLFLSAVQEPGKAADLLAKHGQKNSFNGMAYYRIKNEKPCLAVIGGYLALAENPGLLARVEAVRRGETRAVAGLVEYQQARAALPKDANFMLFFSPSGLEMFAKQGRAMGVNPFRSVRWMAFGATVRDQGIAFDYRMPMDASVMPGLKAVAEIGPIDPAMLKRLPAGAYGLMALSQPGKYWDNLRDSVQGEPSAKRSLDEGVAAFEKETGMSVPRDILPALSGHFLLAVYPDARGPEAGVDGLIVLDDAHGADPAALAEKARVLIKRESAKESRKGVRFVSTQREGATFWTMDAESQNTMRRSLAEGFAPSRSRRLNVTSSSGGVVQTFEVREPVGAGMGKYVQNKTVAYAQVGNAVILASSQALLEKAVAAYQGRERSLAEDPAYVAMRAMLMPRAQSATMVNLAAILEALRPTLEKAMQDSKGGPSADDIIRLFGQANTGLVGSGQYDGKIGTGSLFLPLDYDRAIHLIGMGARRMNAPAGPSTLTSL